MLAPEEWLALEAAHEERIDAATAAHRDRRSGGRTHPVEDFLFRYYTNSPARLRRWHPGPGVVLAEAAHLPRARWTHYRTESDAVRLDVDAFVAARGPAIAFVRGLLSATASRPAQLGCFGLHEWAMVHGIPADDVRHAGWPLRLGSAGTDAVVEAHGIRCSHFDAYRFFTDAAVPLNQASLTREGQVRDEQPGCLHAGMDLYAHVAAMEAGAPGELLLDTLSAAFDAREVDMRASPYDLSAWGLDPIPVDTAEGRSVFVAFQRRWIRRTQSLRARYVVAVDALQTHGSPGHHPAG